MVFNETEQKLVYFSIVSYPSRGDSEGSEWRGRVKIITQTLESGLEQIKNQMATQNTDNT